MSEVTTICFTLAQEKAYLQDLEKNILQGWDKNSAFSYGALVDLYFVMWRLANYFVCGWLQVHPCNS